MEKKDRILLLLYREKARLSIRYEKIHSTKNIDELIDLREKQIKLNIKNNKN